MAKRITKEGLSKLRESIRNKGINSILEVDSFDFSLVDTERIDYPSINESDLSAFYKQFEKDPKDEFQLARILYESLDLTNIQASDNLYWVYLNLNYFFKYLKEGWVHINSDEDEDQLVSKFEQLFLAIKPSQNNLIQSAIAGLWWAVHLTVDVNSKDKYYYTKIFLSDRNLRLKNSGTYQFARHKDSLYAFLDFYNENKDAKWEGIRIGSEAVAQQTSKVLNQIGALVLLSYLSKEEIKEKLDRYKTSILRRAYRVKVGKTKSRERRQNEKQIIKKSDDNKIENLKFSGRKTENKQDLQIKDKSKVLRYFNLNDDGTYNLSPKRDNKFNYSVPITQDHVSGCLLICYREKGYINQVTVESLMKKKDRSIYKNGLYPGQTLKSLLLIPRKAIIGIFYEFEGKRYFKAHLSSMFKQNNSAVGLQGYKTIYKGYDRNSVDFVILPIKIKDSIEKLVFKSFGGSGKLIDNLNYKNEFDIIKKYAPGFFSSND